MPTITIPEQLRPGTKAQRDARDMRIDVVRGTVDEAARTVELAFSSETPVDMWWGVEVLDHKTSSIRLDRLKRAGPLLMDHDRTDHVGVVESVQIGSDKVARAVVRFGKSARAAEVFQDVVDGIRVNVSVGYRIHEAMLESEKDGVGTYRVTDWEPYEISLVSVPADTDVGVGRSAAPQTKTEEKAMSEVTPPPAPPVNTIEHVRKGEENERKRATEIHAIADQYAKYGLEKIAREAVTTGMSVDEFRAKAMQHMTSLPKPTAEIGLSQTEVKRYSLLRALNYLANATDPRARAAAAFEIECSNAAADKAGKASRGLLVPFDILRRDLNVATATAGGHTVATILEAGSFIEMLRNSMVIDRMGARMLTGLVGNIAIPRQTGGATSYWVAESGAPTESQAAFDQVSMTPKTIGAYTDISRKLLQQSSIDVESFVQIDLARAQGLGIQSAAIVGGGSNQPTGVISTAGIGDVAGGTNGAAPTWQHIVDLETDVSVANADVGTLGYLTNAKVRGRLKTTQKFTGTNGVPVWGDGDVPLNGYSTGVTNAVPSNLDKGTSTGVCSAIVFGNWADLIIAMWGGLDLVVDPYTHSTSGTVRIVTLQDVDVAVRHAESFSVMRDALTQ